MNSNRQGNKEQTRQPMWTTTNKCNNSWMIGIQYDKGEDTNQGNPQKHKIGGDQWTLELTEEQMAYMTSTINTRWIHETHASTQHPKATTTGTTEHPLGWPRCKQTRPRPSLRRIMRTLTTILYWIIKNPLYNNVHQQSMNKSLESQIDLLGSLKWNEYDLCLIQEPYIDFKGKTQANWNWIVIYIPGHTSQLPRLHKISNSCQC